MFSFCCPDCYNNYKFGEQCDEEQCIFCFGILEMSLIFSLPSYIIASIFNQIAFWKKPLTMPFNLICKGKLTRRYCLYLLWCAWGKAYYWGCCGPFCYGECWDFEDGVPSCFECSHEISTSRQISVLCNSIQRCQ